MHRSQVDISSPEMGEFTLCQALPISRRDVHHRQRRGMVMTDDEHERWLAAAHLRQQLLKFTIDELAAAARAGEVPVLNDLFASAVRREVRAGFSEELERTEKQRADAITAPIAELLAVQQHALLQQLKDLVKDAPSPQGGEGEDDNPSPDARIGIFGGHSARRRKEATLLAEEETEEEEGEGRAFSIRHHLFGALILISMLAVIVAGFTYHWSVRAEAEAARSKRDLERAQANVEQVCTVRVAIRDRVALLRDTRSFKDQCDKVDPGAKVPELCLAIQNMEGWMGSELASCP